MRPDPNSRSEIVLENIRDRRTVPFQLVTDTPLEPSHLEQLLEAANWAPTHKLTEPWRFALFTGQGRQQLANVLGEVYQRTSGVAFLQKKLEKTTNRPKQVAAVIAVSIAFSGKLPEYEEILAVGGAVQNLQLAAHALGIGCSWSTPAYLEDPAIKSLLRLQANMHCYGFLYLGYLDPTADPVRSVRRPIEEKLIRLET